MNENFFATIKMTTGEEVLSEIMPTEENGEQFFVLSNPIVIHENSTVDAEKGIVMSGLVPKKWLLYSNDDVHIVFRTHVISMSELDKFGIDFYKKALLAAKIASPIRRKVDSKSNTGYVGKVDNLRKKLQGLFDQSPDLNKET
tara:strand:- start:835 stop:1263 length:429 start_codon:yes stop_codon:yes gene_type:complete